MRDPTAARPLSLRLWHALDLQLLAPFEYYACDDATDFSDVPWDRPGEREAVDKLVTGNDVRARLVVNEWRRLASDALRSRALLFCVSVAHAEFMTAWLNRAGLPAACVVGTTPTEERRRAPQRLLSGELCALVTVDLYNEGIDLPMVDTLLLLASDPEPGAVPAADRPRPAPGTGQGELPGARLRRPTSHPSFGSTACCRA